MADRTFLLKIIGDTTGATKALGEVDKGVQNTESTTKKAFGAIGAAVSITAIAAFGKSVVDSASQQEQAIGAVDSVFKETAGTIHDFGQTTAENMGISRGQFEETASTMGALLKNGGMPLDEVADSTINLSKRAADLASMYGGTVPEAMDAMKSALKGEMDPLEKYGVSLKQSAIEARAVADGHVDAEGKATAYGKAVATQALIMEQSADAAGNFAKEGDTLAGQTAKMKAQFADLQADLGTMLLPILAKLSGVLTGIIGFVKQNQGWLIPLAAGIAGVVIAVKAWQLAQTAWSVATTAATGVQWAFNAAMSANPIALIVIAIAAVVAGIVLLYMKVGWFRDFVDECVDAIVSAWDWVLEAVKGVFNWIKDNWPLLLAILTGPFGLAVLAITRNWDSITAFFRELPGKIGGFLSSIWQKITEPFNRAKDTVVQTMENIGNWFRDLPGKIGGWLSSIWSKITEPFRRSKDSVMDTLDDIGDWFYRLPGKVSGWFSGLASKIKYPFEQAFNGIKSLWNNTVGRVSFTVPSWVPGIGGKGWSVPKMAAGGIVNRPTIALIGEAGPEAVVPLNKANGFGMGGVVINVYALTANAEVGQKVWESLQEYERISGRRIG